MFNVNQYVVYGNKGVCKITEIGPIKMPGIPDDRDYYTLSQVSQRGGIVYTPIDKEDTPLRAILSEKEAGELIKLFEEIEVEWIGDDKERNKHFTEIMRRADSRELVEMMVLLERRKKERIAIGKKPTSTDERFFNGASDILCEELSISLGETKEGIRELIESKL